ncbi:hypothetical protein EPN83_01855 [Patescibacteria group bacterium]|nr:MAG: hypothetical protein EPN83_01855 [Patescibacteria group bacterium]
MSKIVAVARDMAPSEGVGACADELEKRGCEVKKFLSFGKPFSGSVEELTQDLQAADVVLCGFSSSEALAQEEIAAAKAAMARGVPLFFYADTFGVYRAPWMSFARSWARVVFVQTEPECSGAQPIFPNARVVASGSPIYEKAFFPPKSRSEIRAGLGLEEEDRMIFVPCGKALVDNGVLIAAVLQALSGLGIEYRPFITLHPGDTNEAAQYKALESYPLRVRARVLGRDDGISSQEALCGTDLVITGGSAAAIEAACMRIPVIDFMPEVIMARMATVRGAWRWERSDLGITRLVRWCSEELRGTVCDLLSLGGYSAMRAVHERCYPKPERQGVAAETMADAVMLLLYL